MEIFFFFAVVISVIYFANAKNTKKPNQDTARGYTREKPSGTSRTHYKEQAEPEEDLFAFLREGRPEEDYLYLAAAEKAKAKEAVETKALDVAWGHLQQQKQHYMGHANSSGFTAEQALSLDASVHEDMANVRRLEGSHKDALVDILYWVIAHKANPIKRHEQKLKSYFNRCKFENISLERAISFVSEYKGLADYSRIQSVVRRWS